MMDRCAGVLVTNASLGEVRAQACLAEDSGVVCLYRLKAGQCQAMVQAKNRVAQKVLVVSSPGMAVLEEFLGVEWLGWKRG